VRQICEANNTLPNVSVRTNTLKTTRDQLIETLEQNEIKAVAGSLAPEAIVIEKGTVQQTEGFREGLFTIQDESSMLAAHALDVKEGMDVLDACAAPGGKSTHIAQLMKNSGRITALDIHTHKIKLIEDQAKRLGISNIDAVNLDSRKAREKFGERKFDRILVDAPCSGFGVIRRKPDIKWSKTKEDVARLADIQEDILVSVAPLLKPGGKMVYSTCTIEKEENERVARSFLENNTRFSLDFSLADKLPMDLGGEAESGMIQILPHTAGTDGFFIAAFKKDGVG
ncbi:MAG TPA: 16S rRNA (cytosine(967)-C(5))-methyltransferase RsmB, partial [Bacillales bacterium]|nr:16S rRNA (cytosine(967)-C(5))-methyltransferase RsmB [Bacillales bacterium]